MCCFPNKSAHAAVSTLPYSEVVAHTCDVTLEPHTSNLWPQCVCACVYKPVQCSLLLVVLSMPCVHSGVPQEAVCVRLSSTFVWSVRMMYCVCT